ncbi:MAG: hypothetical protein IPK89_13505 [Sphingomonadales bacterium]|nr:hypothetical protein [Sphingomonadales bacterium]
MILHSREQWTGSRPGSEIVIARAAMTYPGVERASLQTGILKQLVTFDLGLTNFERQVEMGTDGLPTLAESGRDHSALLHTIDILVIMLLVLSAGRVFIATTGNCKKKSASCSCSLSSGMFGNALLCLFLPSPAWQNATRRACLALSGVHSFMIASRFCRRNSGKR